MISIPLLWILYITLLDVIRQFKNLRYLLQNMHGNKSRMAEQKNMLL